VPEPALSPARDLRLDALRTLAFVLMVGCHVVRLGPRAAWPAWAAPVLDAEPLCQALFLGLVGASLPANRAARPVGFGRRQGRRALAFALVSAGIFLLQYGPQWPAGLRSTGILATIAAGIGLVSPAVATGRPAVLGGLALGLVGLAVGLDRAGAVWVPLNAGNGAVLPYAAAVALGAWAATGPSVARALFGLAALAWAAQVLLGGADPAGLWRAPLGRVETAEALLGKAPLPAHLAAWAEGRSLASGVLRTYTWRPAILPSLGVAVLGLGAVASAARPVLSRAPSLLVLGRQGLFAYLLHLALLAVPVLVAGEARPLRHPRAIDAAALGILVICGLAAAAWERRGRRPG